MKLAIRFSDPYEGIVELFGADYYLSSLDNEIELANILDELHKRGPLPWIRLTDVTFQGTGLPYLLFQPTVAYEVGGESLVANGTFTLSLSDLARGLRNSIPVIEEFKGEYSFLSNFFLSPVKFEWVEYSNAEAAFQAAKTLDLEARKDFQNLSPRKAKAKGRALNLRAHWDVLAPAVMREVLYSKFKNPELRQQLLATQKSILVEGNTWHDQRWGNCVCGREACNSPGNNMLGKLLMEVRETLKAEGSFS